MNDCEVIYKYEFFNYGNPGKGLYPAMKDIQKKSSEPVTVKIAPDFIEVGFLTGFFDEWPHENRKGLLESFSRKTFDGNMCSHVDQTPKKFMRTT